MSRGSVSTIFKYPLSAAPTQYLMLPSGYKLLAVQEQHGVPCLWAAVDPDAAPVAVAVALVGTGHQIDEDGFQYVGTFQLEGGYFVWHVYATTEVES